MPARAVAITDAPETTVEAAKKNLAFSLRSHLQAVTRVRMERRKQGLTKNRFLPHDVLVVRTPGEEDDALIESIVIAVFEEIAEDSSDGSWLGVLHLVNERATKRAERELADIPVRIEDVESIATRDGEVISLINVLRLFTADLCTQVVKVIGASAQREAALGAREAAISDMVVGVAKHNTSESEARYKFEWRKAKLEAKGARHEIDMEAKVYRSSATKFMFSDILSKYQPTIDLLTRIHAKNQGVDPGKQQPMPAKPTAKEILAVFPEPVADANGATADDDLHDIRQVALAMLKSQGVERAALRSQLVIELARLGDRLEALREIADAKLGAQRVAEILAWFRSPWD